MDGEPDRSMGEFGCILAFDTDDPQFARGFEAGRLWTCLQQSPDREIEQLVHASNAEMAIRMAEALGRSVRSHEDDAGSWLTVVFNPVDVDSLQQGFGAPNP